MDWADIVEALERTNRVTITLTCGDYMTPNNNYCSGDFWKIEVNDEEEVTVRLPRSRYSKKRIVEHVQNNFGIDCEITRINF